MRYGFLHATFLYADKQDIEGIRSHSGFRIPLFRVRPSAILSVCHFGIPSLLFYVVNDTEYLSPSAFLHKGKSLFLMHNASYKRGSFAPIILTFLPSFYPRRCLGLTCFAPPVLYLVASLPPVRCLGCILRALCFPLRYSLRTSNFVSALTFQPSRGTICREKGCRPFH